MQEKYVKIYNLQVSEKLSKFVSDELLKDTDVSVEKFWMGLNETLDDIFELYDKKVSETFELMIAKNHDYGEAWRDMEVISLTDLIIQKIFRMKSILKNDGKTSVSEGIDANFQDILNYSVFAQILLKE